MFICFNVTLMAPYARSFQAGKLIRFLFWSFEFREFEFVSDFEFRMGINTPFEGGAETSRSAGGVLLMNSLEGVLEVIGETTPNARCDLSTQKFVLQR